MAKAAYSTAIEGLRGKAGTAVFCRKDARGGGAAGGDGGLSCGAAL